MKKQLAKLRQPRWRHGKLGALMLAAFIAACVLVNAGVTALEEAYGWQRDLSFNGYATTGAETQKVLERLEHDVELYLLYQSGAVDAEVLNLLQRYGVLSDRVSVLPTDLSRNPGILTRFQGDVDKAIEADTVIVNCPDTGRYKLLTYEDFITTGYNTETCEFELEGLAYEKNLTEAIVYVAQEEISVVGILQGHGELNEAALNVLISFLTSNHYATQTVNLLEGDTLSQVDLLLIASPQKDLNDLEVDMISAYAQDGGHFFITRDYTDPMDLPNYMALLRSYGVVPLDGVVAAGEQDKGSYYGDVFQLIPYMETMDMTMNLTTSGMDLLLLPYASAFETPGEATASLTTATVLKTGPNAYVRRVSDGVDSAERQPGDITGELSVGLYAHRMYANGNVSRMFALGNSPAIIWEYIYTSSYTEEFLIAVLGDMLPQSRVSLDIMASTALRPSLTVGSQTAGVALIVALPLLVLAVGLLVLLPRRNR